MPGTCREAVLPDISKRYPVNSPENSEFLYLCGTHSREALTWWNSAPSAAACTPLCITSTGLPLRLFVTTLRSLCIASVSLRVPSTVSTQGERPTHPLATQRHISGLSRRAATEPNLET